MTTDTCSNRSTVKINSADFSDGGLTLEESRQVCIWLDEMGLDLIELSGGTYESMAFEVRQSPPSAPSFGTRH